MDIITSHLILPILILLPIAHGYSILLLAPEVGSHVSYMSGVAKGCVEAGINVSFALSSAYPERDVQALADNDVTVVQFKTRRPRPIYREIERMQTEYFNLYLVDRAHDAKAFMIEREIEDVWEMMDDVHFMEAVKASSFDLVVIDGFLLGLARFVLPYKLSLPYAVVTSYYLPWIMRIPALPSFVPLMKVTYTEKMTFSERLHNTMLFFEESMFSPQAADSTWERYLPKENPPTIFDLLNKAEVSLLNNDILMGYPVPLMPNTIQVGGLTVQPPGKLDPDISSFLNATDGVILASFGSVMRIIPEMLSWKIYRALEQIKHPVIMRYDGPSKVLPENIKVMKWLPQNDLLAHPKVKVFVTHCGNNGQMEALYHGVPMVGVPMFYDQHQGGARIEYQGYGNMYNIVNDPPEKLTELINEVFENKTYKGNIQRASAIFRARPDTPRQRAAFWVKHVLKFGSKHLRSHANDMPLYQYWMVDTMAFLLCLSIVAIFSSLLLLYVAIRGLCFLLNIIQGQSPKLKQK